MRLPDAITLVERGQDNKYRSIFQEDALAQTTSMVKLRFRDRLISPQLQSWVTDI
jgi:hypothetical protein